MEQERQQDTRATERTIGDLFEEYSLARRLYNQIGVKLTVMHNRIVNFPRNKYLDAPFGVLVATDGGSARARIAPSFSTHELAALIDEHDRQRMHVERLHEELKNRGAQGLGDIPDHRPKDKHKELSASVMEEVEAHRQDLPGVQVPSQSYHVNPDGLTVTEDGAPGAERQFKQEALGRRVDAGGGHSGEELPAKDVWLIGRQGAQITVNVPTLDGNAVHCEISAGLAKRVATDMLRFAEDVVHDRPSTLDATTPVSTDTSRPGGWDVKTLINGEVRIVSPRVNEQFVAGDRRWFDFEPDVAIDLARAMKRRAKDSLARDGRG